MPTYTLPLRAITRADIALVGGKAAALGELTRIDAARVPDGFCVTTAAYRRSAGRAMPDDIKEEITGRLAELGAGVAVAVRSSATAEDLPDASFAGQQDTYLNVIGADAVLDAIRRCWASLFTERAVAYRAQHGIDSRDLSMAVVVQRMVHAEAAGVLFTADPLSGHRAVASIDAAAGPGEALVSGRVTPDTYRVRGGVIIEKRIIDPQRQILTDAQLLRLERLGRAIEAHFGSPQDIEWALAPDAFSILQSRPITTLFPIPRAPDPGPRVYLSVGHQQMMTDAMRPLGWSFFQLTAGRPMFEAGGRLFVDVTAQLATPTARAALLAGMAQHDPLMQDALLTLLARGDVIPPLPEAPPGDAPVAPPPPPPPDPSVVTELIERSRAAIAELDRTIRAQTGAALFDFILADIQQLKASLFTPANLAAILASMNAAAWLNEKLLTWLGEPNAADTLSQSAPGNVTAEMGLALLDTADALRPYPQVVAYLEQAPGDGFLAGLAALDGGEAARAALDAFLDRYGVRCSGEIDITRPRWREDPAALAPLLLGNIRNFAPGAGRRLFEQGRQAAADKAQELLARLGALPDGAAKAEETAVMIRQLRAFAGYREYPKYAIVSRYFLYKQALLREADRLAQEGVIRGREDIYDLTFDELRAAVAEGRVDGELIRQRQASHRHNARLTPPRVITSDGEIFTGAYHRGPLPPGALAGLPVSAGVVEGRARVILDLAAADLAPGDILITRFTDPAWTPLFVSIAALVTEVGGLMTHGAVIAREYGLPAVVGVENATRLIPDGARVRVDGGAGIVAIVSL